MTTGYLVVETQLASPDLVDEYHTWYNGTHLPEILAIEGFVSATRLEAIDGTSFLALYEIDIDVETAMANLRATQGTGVMSTPVGVVMDPPPSARYFRQIYQLEA
jgi:hypothetical protein